MRRGYFLPSFLVALFVAPACLNLSTTDTTSSSSSGAGGSGLESVSSSSSSSSGEGGKGGVLIGAGGFGGFGVGGAGASGGAGGIGGSGGAVISPLPGWSRRRAVTVVPQSANLNNFILLVVATQDTAFGGDIQPDGDDVVFTDSDETTILPYEFEHFDSGAGLTNFVAWIRVPQIPAQGKTLYLYYGNPNVASQQNRDAAWQDYRAVYHLETDFKDSTKNGHDGTTKTAGGSLPTATSGMIGTGRRFPGGSFGEIPHSPEFDCANKTCMVSAWINASGGTGHIVDHFINSSGDGWYVGFNNGDATYVHGAALTPLQLAGSMPTNSWHHVAVISSPGSGMMYIDGVQAQTKNSSFFLVNAQAPLYLGAASSSSYFFVGSLDEVRIATLSRNAAWIEAEVLNQQKPDDFAMLGPVEKY